MTQDNGMDKPDRVEELEKEIRRFTCPKQRYQATDKSPAWSICTSLNGRPFVRCPLWPDKKKCWDRFDQEVAK